jgi:carboxyl-terminal processing protease
MHKGPNPKEGATMGKRKFLLPWTLLGVTALALGLVTAGLARSISAADAGSQIYRQLDLFEEVLQYVRSDYVDRPDNAKLIKGAINGMLSELDPHSSYMDPEQFRDMQVEETGEFGGLGLEVTMEDGVVKVIAPVEGTPAAKAGIQSGDLITAINGKNIQDLTLEDAVEKLRGRVHTPVMITITRKGLEKPFDVKIVRDTIHIVPVKYDAEDGVGYIRITSFNDQAAGDLRAAIEDLSKKIGPKLKGYVIDLRNDPGGLLDQAILVSNTVLDHGEIVSIKGRHPDQTRVYNAHPGDLTKGAKLVVLINGGSASASEIVAGALKDNHRATIVGTRSFGKGSVQTIVPLPNKGALRLTTARYFTPSGRSIQAEGIEPDVVIAEQVPPELKDKIAAEDVTSEASLPHHLKNENSVGRKDTEHKEQFGSATYVNPDKQKDAQLLYALGLLQGKTVSVDTVNEKAEAN